MSQYKTVDRVLMEWTPSVTYSVCLPSERFVLFLQYKTVDRVLAERPTVVMMAHINPLKDIVTAIRAAKLIVEEYKVTGVPHYINQSIYVSCLQDSSGESTDNVWEHNIH